MKYTVVRIVSLLLVLSMLVPVYTLAADVETDSVYTFVYEDRTIEIDSTDLTYEQAKMIADRIVYGDSEVSTYGILCLFGHDIATTHAQEITHKEYAAAPRCVRRLYKVDYCTRSSCSHSEATLLSTIRIPCCD